MKIKQIGSIARSRRALMVLLAAASGVAAIFFQGIIGQLLGVTAVGLLTFTLLHLGILFTENRARSELLRRDVNRLSEMTSAREEDEPDLRRARRLSSVVSRLEPEPLPPPDSTGWGGSVAPQVTVVVPCYNERRYVAEALRSVLAQSYENWECIVVDDASTDDSLAEIWSVASTDDRFRVVRHLANSGLSAARNTGLRAARGQFVTFLDSDDLLLADSLLDRVLALTTSLGDPAVIGSYSDVKVDLEDVRLEDYPGYLRRHSEGIVDLISADSECPFPAHGPLLRTDTTRALGGFREHMLNGAEDWDLWYRAMRNGFVFVPSRFRTIVYRQKQGSMVREKAELHVLEANRLIDAAHQKVADGVIIPAAASPLIEPLGHYQALLRKADRAIRFAVLALAADRKDAARQALAILADVPESLLVRHLDVEDLFAQAIQRAFSIDRDDFSDIEGLTAPIRRELARMMAGFSRNPTPTPGTSGATGTEVEALLIPHQAGQLAAMIEAATAMGYGRDSLNILNLEREAGKQGMSPEIPDDLKVLSLNQWCLGGAACRTAFVGSVRIGIVDEIAHDIESRGGVIVELKQDLAHLMDLDTSRRKTRAAPRPRSLADSRPVLVGAAEEPTEAWQIEEYPGTIFDAADLAEMRDSHKGQRAVIIGNGPSLNDCDLTLLAAENTIAVNGIFYARDRMGFSPTFYVVEDTAFMRDNLDEIVSYAAGHKFFPSLYRKLVGEKPDVSYFMMNRGFYEPRSHDFCVPRFSVDASQRLFSGQSVTIINLQLAYFLGFEEVVLIGMDFSYEIPSNADVAGDIVTSHGDDPNHFHPDYFGAGKVWKDPKLERVLSNYALAKQVYESAGRRIVNATVGGKLELFERVSYVDAFS